MFEASVYQARREALLRGLAARGIREGILLLLGNALSPMNYRDNTYPFRQDSSFLYFLGLPLPGLAATMDLPSGRTVLFGDEPSMDDIVWTGPVHSLADLAASAGITETMSRSALPNAVAVSPVHYFPPYRASTRAEIAALSGRPYAAVDASASLPLVRAAIELREIKSDAELAQMERAVAVTVDMHKAALATARPGMIEADVLARLTQVALASRGALAFPAIATTKASILHAHSYDRVLEEGGLFLVDAGAETEMGYAADLSTSFPIGSRFDARQREIYEIVLAASSLASSMLRPGLAFRDLHFAAAKALSTGLKELGLMKGDLDEAVQAGAHALFFPTGLGHMLGLDVHDMESYGEVWVGYDGEPKSELFGLKSLRLAKPLKPGMVLTIEPGIYFIPELVERWKAEGRFSEFIAYERIAAYMAVGGIRNEEDWVVTAEGARRLGPRFDKSVAAIEAARA